MSDERDFYEEAPAPHDCVGFCLYCKEAVMEGDDVTYKGFLYHKDCFLLEHTGEEEVNE